MAEELPGVCDEPDPETRRYVLNHTMVRIKDAARSLDFYTRVLGMKLVSRFDFEEWRFSLYFLQARGNGPVTGLPQNFHRQYSSTRSGGGNATVRRYRSNAPGRSPLATSAARISAASTSAFSGTLSPAS